MPLLQLSRASLAYGHLALLDHADLVVEAGERIGLIGRNGTGKSSLLRIVEGAARPDDGTVWSAPGLRLAAVHQEPSFAPGQTIFEAAASGMGAARQLLLDYHAAAHGGDTLAADVDERAARRDAAPDQASPCGRWWRCGRQERR